MSSDVAPLTKMASAIYRLVVTGEDRPRNFQRLFGPHWEVAVTSGWEAIRLQVLTKPVPEPATYSYGGVRSPMDKHAPIYQPRPANEEERRKILRYEPLREDGVFQVSFLRAFTPTGKLSNI